MIDRRVEQMKAEGVIFRTSVLIGKDFPASGQQLGHAKPSSRKTWTRNSTPSSSPAAPSSRATCRCRAAS